MEQLLQFCGYLFIIFSTAGVLIGGVWIIAQGANENALDRLQGQIYKKAEREYAEELHKQLNGLDLKVELILKKFGKKKR